MIAEKYVLTDTYLTGSHSDDAGWTDGWDPDIIRCTCVPPMNDSERSALVLNPGTDDPTAYYVFNLGSAHTGGFNAVFADGSVHTINYDIDRFVLNALGTRNGTSAGSSATPPAPDSFRRFKWILRPPPTSRPLR